MNKSVSVPRRAFACLCLIAAMALLLGACQDTAENESGTITIAIGVSPTARWLGTKPTEDFLKNSVTHVIELWNGSDYGTKIRTITLTPGNTSHTEMNVPLGALRVEIRATLNGYDFAYGDTEITVASGNNPAPVTMERLEHGIVLSEKSGSTYHFPALTQGYNSTTPLTVTVTNYAENATGALTVALAGTDPGSFTLSATSIADILQDGHNTFTVTPITGLAVGNHTATVSVTGNNDIDAFFTVSVLVGDILNVANTADWNAAITAIKNGGNSKGYTINLTGDFDASGTTAETFGAVTTLNVTIAGNHTITLTGTGNLLYIGGGQTVTLKDAHLEGNSSNTTVLVLVNRGKLDMESGSISDNTSSNNNSDNSGGGVYVVGSGGIFNMSGGTISGNTVNKFNTGGILTTRTGQGGGVYIASGGTFNMSGTATISGNTSNNLGGGVMINSGTFNMEGGTITNNNTDDSGGGVYVGSGAVGSGTFIMIGGTIGPDNKAGRGGGVFLEYSGSIFDLKDLDLVKGNTAIAITNPAKEVYVSGGTFKINGSAPSDPADLAKNDGVNYYWP